MADRGDIDFAYSNSFGRFRACVVKQRLGYDLTFRIINSQVQAMTSSACLRSLSCSHSIITAWCW